jgi:hypothetical protein
MNRFKAMSSANRFRKYESGSQKCKKKTSEVKKKTLEEKVSHVICKSLLHIHYFGYILYYDSGLN